MLLRSDIAMVIFPKSIAFDEIVQLCLQSLALNFRPLWLFGYVQAQSGFCFYSWFTINNNTSAHSMHSFFIIVNCIYIYIYNTHVCMMFVFALCAMYGVRGTAEYVIFLFLILIRIKQWISMETSMDNRNGIINKQGRLQAWC